MSVFVIAEAGVNHNGSLDMARQLIDAAADAGADAVKFQTFRAADLVQQDAPKAAYQQRSTGTDESQYAMLAKLELPYDAHFGLQDHAVRRGIQFLSTPFDNASLDFLTHKLGMATVKIPSGEITNGPFLLRIARAAKDVILSTGMSTLDDIEAALSVLAFGFTAAADVEPGRQAFAAARTSSAGQAALRERVTVLHCTSEYPAPADQANLRAMDTLQKTFGLRVGYSDHTEGLHVAVAAVARGACVIEKHFTLDRKLPGPDHAASLEPTELAAMVKALRDIPAALGDGVKRPTQAELRNLGVVRKSLVTARPVRQGEAFAADALAAKRPGTGVSPMEYWDRCGSKAERAYATDEMIEP